jgi:hydrogenase expression/formation protein HypE
MHRLLERMILPALDNEVLRQGHDSAVLVRDAPGRIAFTTDSYVVRPRFFPGGDIGTLAVNGTVNDLAMAGAQPLWLSAGLILEEGLPMEELQRTLASMKIAADAAGVAIVTGDTKVVDRGHGDGLYINTSGIGIIEHDLAIGAQSIRAGDVILLSGDIGRHGICILAEREKLAFESTIESDTAALHQPVLALIEAGLPIHCLRDLTRGGLASALKELMLASRLSAEIRESDIPVEPQVRGACEILGLDPLYVANEGRMIVILPESEAKSALEILSGFQETANSRAIGAIDAGLSGQLVLKSTLGTHRVVNMLPGEQLPRIC